MSDDYKLELYINLFLTLSTIYIVALAILIFICYSLYLFYKIRLKKNEDIDKYID